MRRLLLVVSVGALVLGPSAAYAQYYPYGYYPQQYYYQPPPPPPPSYMYRGGPPAYPQPYYNAPPSYSPANCGTPDQPKPCYR
jgi:hypothetical protein